MRSGWVGSVAVVLAASVAGCTEVVPGAAAAGVPTVPPSSAAVPSAPPAPAGPRSALDADVVRDECLLNAAEFGALVGVAVRPPERAAVQRDEGPAGVGCVAAAGTDPVAMINVYSVRSGVPADYVRGGPPGGRRDLPGVGEAAAVFDTPSGPTLQLAGPRFLVTIAVTGRTPSDDAWRTAATAALSRLPS